MALIRSTIKREVTDSEVKSFRKQLAPAADTARRNTGGWGKNTRVDLFAPYVLVLYADNVVPRDPTKKGFNKFVFLVADFDEKDYKGWALNAETHRWNAEKKCLEIALQRHITKNEEIKSSDKYYPSDKNAWRWVEAKPLQFLSITDFDSKNVRELEGQVVRLWEVCPRARDPTKKDEYGTFNWRVARFVPELRTKIPYTSMCSIVKLLPPELFHIDERIGEENPDKQNTVMVRTVCPWDTETLKSLLNEERYTVAFVTTGYGVDDWAMGHKDKKKIEGLPQIPPTDNNDKKERALKRVTLRMVVQQKDEKGTEKFVANMPLWNEDIEQIFHIHDVGRWWDVARYWIAHLKDLTVLAGIQPSTDKDSYNLQMHGGEGVGGNDFNQDEEEAPPPAPPVEMPPTTQQGGDEMDLDAIMNAQSATAGGKTATDTRFDLFLALSPMRVYFDAANTYHSLLVPVTPEWATVPTAGKSGLPALAPYLRTIKTPQGTWEAPPGIKKPDGTWALQPGATPNFLDPKNLPAVVNISDRSPDSTAVKSFAPMVRKGEGEFRVMVNSPLLVMNEGESDEIADKRDNFFANVGRLTPEEGVKLLNEGAVTLKDGTVVELTRSSDPQYILYYINKHAINPVTRAKAAEASVATLKRYIIKDHSGEGAALPPAASAEHPSALAEDQPKDVVIQDAVVVGENEETSERQHVGSKSKSRDEESNEGSKRHRSHKEKKEKKGK